MENSQLRLYRMVSLAMASIFAVVGMIFIFLPDPVLEFFNRLSPLLDLSPAPLQSGSFFPILAVAYMVLVTMLAGSMFRKPGNRHFSAAAGSGKTCQLHRIPVLFF